MQRYILQNHLEAWRKTGKVHHAALAAQQTDEGANTIGILGIRLL